MKIKKLVESKKLLEDDAVDPMKDPVKEIADEIKDSVEDATNGEQEISDADAAAIAKETKDTAEEVNAGYVAFNLTDDDWSDATITNDVYEVLDMALASARSSIQNGKKSGANVLINGLAGSGKTAIVEYWAKSHGLRLIALNATDSKSDAAINGMPVRDQDKPDELIYLFNNKKLGDLLNPDYAGQCIIFVDELNRQLTGQLRRPLMSLFNEKRNADGSKDFSKNLLFSVVCINPSDGNGMKFHDTVADIFGAEDDRFPFQVEEFDSKIKDARNYWEFLRKTTLLKAGIIMPGSKASANHNGWFGPTRDLSQAELDGIKRTLKEAELALYLLNNCIKKSSVPATELFSQRADIDNEYKENRRRPLSARGLEWGINIAGDNTPVDKDITGAFLDYVDKFSKWSKAKKRMIHDTLDTYNMDVQGLFAAYNLDKSAKEIENALANPNSAASNSGSGSATTAKAAGNADMGKEDDNTMFSADEVSNVSKASTGDLGKDVINDIMDQWSMD